MREKLVFSALSHLIQLYDSRSFMVAKMTTYAYGAIDGVVTNKQKKKNQLDRYKYAVR
jgi:hypothetical protein